LAQNDKWSKTQQTYLLLFRRKETVLWTCPIYISVQLCYTSPCKPTGQQSPTNHASLSTNVTVSWRRTEQKTDDMKPLAPSSLPSTEMHICVRAQFVTRLAQRGISNEYANKLKTVIDGDIWGSRSGNTVDTYLL
jgi:hypothetical protein